MPELFIPKSREKVPEFFAFFPGNRLIIQQAGKAERDISGRFPVAFRESGIAAIPIPLERGFLPSVCRFADEMEYIIPEDMRFSFLVAADQRTFLTVYK